MEWVIKGMARDGLGGDGVGHRKQQWKCANGSGRQTNVDLALNVIKNGKCAADYLVQLSMLSLSLSPLSLFHPHPHTHSLNSQRPWSHIFRAIQSDVGCSTIAHRVGAILEFLHALPARDTATATHRYTDTQIHRQTDGRIQILRNRDKGIQRDIWYSHATSSEQRAAKNKTHTHGKK